MGGPLVVSVVGVVEEGDAFGFERSCQFGEIADQHVRLDVHQRIEAEGKVNRLDHPPSGEIVRRSFQTWHEDSQRNAHGSPRCTWVRRQRQSTFRSALGDTPSNARSLVLSPTRQRRAESDECEGRRCRTTASPRRPRVSTRRLLANASHSRRSTSQYSPRCWARWALPFPGRRPWRRHRPRGWQGAHMARQAHSAGRRPSVDARRAWISLLKLTLEKQAEPPSRPPIATRGTDWPGEGPLEQSGVLSGDRRPVTPCAATGKSPAGGPKRPTGRHECRKCAPTDGVASG